jgi:hypothetical protein
MIRRAARPLRSILLCSLLMALAPTGASALDIATCNDQVGAGEIADLVADLACGPGDFGIALGPRAWLRLNGFELRGRQGAAAVRCTRTSCTVIGPGRITAAETAIDLEDDVRLKVHNLELDGNDAGIIGEQGPAISGGNSSVRATGLIVRNSTVIGVNTGVFSGQSVVLEGNADRGIWARVIRGQDFTVIGNGNHGLDARGRIAIENLEATGNSGAGVHCEGPVRLRDSTLTGNSPLDLIAERVRLKNTVCGTSNLGVCIDD